MRRVNEQLAADRERAILDYLHECLSGGGCAPTIREICRHCGISSTSVVGKYLDTLEEKGMITRQGTTDRASGRTIRLTEDAGGTLCHVPIIGTVAAGMPIFAEENHEGYLPFGTGRAYRTEDLFALRIRGESMVNAGILNGDFVIVERGNTAENGTIVVALLDDEATCKTFFREDGRYRLQPENDTMDPIYADEVTLLGRVVASVREYR